MASTDTPATGSSHLRLTIPSLSHTQLVPEELEELVRETPTTGAFSALTVVDVRAGDFNGGHLRGSVHISFESLESSWSSLVSQVSAARVARLVFVCLNGRQRSPVVAETFLAKFKDEAGPEAEAPQVYVLTTGFTGVLNRYIDIAADKTVSLKSTGAELISDFDASQWQVVNVPRTPSNADLPNSAQQVVYRASVDSAHVFLATKEE